jgi:hypothetical protein
LDLGPPPEPISNEDMDLVRDADLFHGRKWAMERTREWVYWLSGWIAGERDPAEEADAARDRELFRRLEKPMLTPLEVAEHRRQDDETVQQLRERLAVRDGQ